MDIKCRKTSCKYNNAYTCSAKNVDISCAVECKTFEPDTTRKAEDFSRNMFEADTENYSNSRHIKNVSLFCLAGNCLFNCSGKCKANGITVLDDDKSCALCGTFIKN